MTMESERYNSYNPNTNQSTYLINDLFCTYIESGIVQLIFKTLCSDIFLGKPGLETIDIEFKRRLEQYCNFDFKFEYKKTEEQEKFAITVNDKVIDFVIVDSNIILSKL